jgi:hypothetical protein
MFCTVMVSLTLREGRKLQLFEIEVARKMSGLKEDEVSKQFRLLSNEELCDLYRSPDIVKTVKCGRL